MHSSISLLVDLPHYHLNSHSLTIFSELNDKGGMRKLNSQSNLLHSSQQQQNSSMNDVFPLILVIWNNVNASPLSSSPSSGSQFGLASVNKKGFLKGDDKIPFVNGRERRWSVDKNKISDKPSFVSISIIHFLKNRIPTVIRKLNFCAEGVFIPRVIHSIILSFYHSIIHFRQYH